MEPFGYAPYFAVEAGSRKPPNGSYISTGAGAPADRGFVESRRLLEEIEAQRVHCWADLRMPPAVSPKP